MRAKGSGMWTTFAMCWFVPNWSVVLYVVELTCLEIKVKLLEALTYSEFLQMTLHVHVHVDELVPSISRVFN